MCGIAGFWTADDRAADRELLDGMCASLEHRGPDAAGSFFDRGVALGHRRLSIIDIAGGAQPLGNEDGSVQVIFNGEIYNFQDLRRDLGRRHRFVTNSDTEVLVHLYEEVGERLLEELNGMFAFVMWDRRRQRLFAARDRFGKKPLYYTESAPGFRFCFASELKAFAALPGFAPGVDAQAVADFLSLSYVPDPATIYEGVHKLEPGHAMTVDRAGSRRWRYWRPEFASGEQIRFDEAVEELRALAADAVRRRMISDAPLGAFLSGGVDSSAVVGLMAREAPERVKTFSIGFTDRSFDELRYARLAVERNRTDHHEEIVSPSVHGVLATLVRHFDEPFGDSSAIPMLYLARMTRQHVTVALSGDGADEVFAGYRRYRFGVLEQRLRERFPGWFRRTLFRAGGRYYPKFDYLPQVFRAKTMLTNLSQEIGDAYFTSMSTFRDDGLERALSPEMRRSLNGYSPRETYRERFRRVRRLGPLEQMQAVDFETYLPGDILVKADRATMAHSLESRSPWLDYRLTELACRLPAAHRLRGAAGKYVFKKAMAPYVPAPLIARRKMGFSVPLAAWFRSSLRGAFEALALAPAFGELCAPAEVHRIWAEHQSGLHNHDRKLWNLLMLAAWNQTHRHGRRRELAEELAAGVS
jgi:asparagine synthase (glutamine-hydrolysing)